ncbi:beta/alpha barrel domain-containing protein [Mariniblastus fucicola]|uniref:Dihydroorotate dehydrogenase 2 n=1 Tax=Mariniblastus fucicola TaxID=980251 RepID=A0A5B9PBD9_9BACT|nr:hypothetical protein [Mariniblastus fucicola]QEG20441.1 dihydroorotate dehydrogenase 2 [Mariniblastus fucicola]
MSIDLTTRLGTLELQSPIIVGSCPMTTEEPLRISMIDNHVGAIALPSVDPTQQFDEADFFRQIEDAVASTIPTFASLRVPINSGVDWFDLPARLESAGISAIEISIERRGLSGVTDPREIEDGLVDAIRNADEQTELPIFVKLTSNFTSISHLAKRLRPFAEGLIMFGKPPVVDIALDSLSLSTKWGLSPPGSVVSSLESILRSRNEYPDMPLIACGGIGSCEDFIKAIVVGADAVMVTSTLYHNGVGTIGVLKDGLTKYMSDRGVSDISSLQSLCPPYSESSLAGLDRFAADPVVEKPKGQLASSVHGDRFGHPQ